MNLYTTMHKEFESNKDLIEFSRKYERSIDRFLMIRSMNKKYILDFYKENKKEVEYSKEFDLMNALFNSDFETSIIEKFILEQRNKLVLEREKEAEGLNELLSQIPIHSAGIRDDKVDSLLKSFVRNKNIKEFQILENELDNNLLTKVRNYALWSFYNQTANDLIELTLVEHPNVIPTLRKIHDIDFFVKIEDKLIPFDLKITHISDDYFNLFSKGVHENTDGFDDFIPIESDEKSESEKIKNIYKANKKRLSLPKMGGLKTNQLIQELKEKDSDPVISKFLSEITEARKQIVISTIENTKILEWWNYKYQGERLFCNNNRFFIFLTYLDKFQDARKLKGHISQISDKINELLNNITLNKVNTIQYHYEKEKSYEKDYTVQAMSIVYVNEN